MRETNKLDSTASRQQNRLSLQPAKPAPRRTSKTGGASGQQNRPHLAPAKPAEPPASKNRPCLAPAIAARAFVSCIARLRALCDPILAQSPLAGGPLPLAGSSSRSDRDSNSGYAFGVYTLSRRASSATRASLHIYLMPVLRGMDAGLRAALRAIDRLYQCKVNAFRPNSNTFADIFINFVLFFVYLSSLRA